MPCTVIVGAQWGDEGKGKIVDTLAERADVVARYQGGNNAGHTLVLGDETYKLRLVPSGVLWPGTLCVLGNGCVIDPEVLIEELDGLEERGISLSGVRISGNAHLIMPWHRIIDADSELMLGRLQIGTTRRGIGPAYADKASRVGIRVQDLLDEKILRQKIQTALSVKNVLLRKIYHQRPLDKDVLTEANSTRIREHGGEYGTVTGRERRCGWLDVVALRYAARLNGLTQLALTKLDVLSIFESIPVCTAYRLPDGSVTEDFPWHQSDFHHAQPVYERLEGWSTDISAVRDAGQLPRAARDYLAFIEERVGVEVAIVGIGQRRDQIITLRDVLEAA